MGHEEEAALSLSDYLTAEERDAVTAELAALLADASRPDAASDALARTLTETERVVGQTADRAVIVARQRHGNQGVAAAFKAKGTWRQEKIAPVAEAITAHPNTPLPLLVRLAPEHPVAFFRNPAAGLLPLEDPGFLLRIPREGLQTLLRREDAPGWLPAQLTDLGDAAVAGEAAMHVRFAGEAGMGWPAELRTALTSLAATEEIKPGCVTTEELAELGILPAWVLAGVTAAPAASDDRPPEHVAGDAAGYEEDLRRAGDPVTPPDQLDALADHVSWDIRLSVARNPAAPGSALARLCKSTYKGILPHVIAGHPGATEKALEHLARSEDAFVRRAARNHPGTTERVRTAGREKAGELALHGPLEWPVTGLFVALSVLRDGKAGRHGHADSNHWWRRLAACLVPASLSEESHRLRPILEPLTRDGNRFVRAAARDRIAAPGAPCPLD